MIQIIRSGKTPAGNTNWKPEPPNSKGANKISVEVDTRAACFKRLPSYSTSIGGIGRHYLTTGVSLLENQLRSGFKICIYNKGAGTNLLNTAKQYQWHIIWMGVETYPDSTD